MAQQLAAPERLDIEQPTAERRQAGTAIEVVKQVVDLLAQFFQGAPQVCGHGMLVGFVFGSDRHFLRNCSSLGTPLQVEGSLRTSSARAARTVRMGYRVSVPRHSIQAA
jgi:hypothetical protein